MKTIAVLLVLLAALCLPALHASAQTTTVEVAYPAGYSLAGAPGGTSLDWAAALFSWNGSAYVQQTTTTVSTCTGYFAYYRQPHTQDLPDNVTGPTQSCPLHAGFTLVGNPFSGTALLPAGTIAWTYNTASNSYAATLSIPTGGAVWIYSPVATAVTLTYGGETTRLPRTLTVTTLSGINQYTIHVGDAFTLQVPYGFVSTATTDPALLRLESSGQFGALSCINNSDCQFNYTTQFYTWRAITTGTATITVVPLCPPTGTCNAPLKLTVTII